MLATSTLRRLLNRLEFHLLYTFLSVYNRAWCLGWMRARVRSRCRRRWRVMPVGRPLVIGDSQMTFGFSRPAAGRLVQVG